MTKLRLARPVRSNFTTANTDDWRIASACHTNAGARWIDWWGPDSCGYEHELDRAGAYELGDLLKDAWNLQRRELVVVPDYVARRLATLDGGGRARNNHETWNLLYLAALFRGPDRPRWPEPWDEVKFRKELQRELESLARRFPLLKPVSVYRMSGTVNGLVTRIPMLRGEESWMCVEGAGWVRCVDVGEPEEEAQCSES